MKARIKAVAVGREEGSGDKEMGSAGLSCSLLVQGGRGQGRGCGGECVSEESVTPGWSSCVSGGCLPTRPTSSGRRRFGEKVMSSVLDGAVNKLIFHKVLKAVLAT